MLIFDGPSNKATALFHSRKSKKKADIYSSSYQVSIYVFSNQSDFDLMSNVVISEVAIIPDNMYYGRSFNNGVTRVAYVVQPNLRVMLDFAYSGPDSYVFAANQPCQFGGIWILSVRTRTPQSTEVLFNYCEEKIVEIFYVANPSDKLLVIDIHYPGISTSKSDVLRLDFSVYKIYNSKQIITLNNSIIAHKNITLPPSVDFVQMFSTRKNAHQVRLTLDPTRVYDVRISAVHYNSPEDCTYKLILKLNDENLNRWCRKETATQNEKIVESEYIIAVINDDTSKTKKSTLYEVHDSAYRVTEIYFDCGTCSPHGIINAQVKFLQTFNMEYVTYAPTSNFLSRPIEIWTGRSMKHYIWISSPENTTSFEMSYFIKQVTLNWFVVNITFLECHNGERYEINSYRRSPETFLTRGCQQGCVLDIHYLYLRQSKSSYDPEKFAYHFYYAFREFKNESLPRIVTFSGKQLSNR